MALKCFSLKNNWIFHSLRIFILIIPSWNCYLPRIEHSQQALRKLFTAHSLSCVLNSERIIELHWQQSMWQQKKSSKERGRSDEERICFTYTSPYKFINEEEKWIKCSRMVHIVFYHWQWLLTPQHHGCCIKRALNLINFHRKTKGN